MNDTTVGAWLTTDPAVSASGNLELDIVIGYHWENAVRTVTTVPIGSGDYRPALAQADAAILAAGYERDGDWAATNDAFVAELVRAA